MLSIVPSEIRTPFSSHSFGSLSSRLAKITGLTHVASSNQLARASFRIRCNTAIAYTHCAQRPTISFQLSADHVRIQRFTRFGISKRSFITYNSKKSPEKILLTSCKRLISSLVEATSCVSGVGETLVNYSSFGVRGHESSSNAFD
jgi:hypothetical protein